MKVFGAVAIACAIVVGLAIMFAVPTMLLWDWLATSLFGLREITLFEAWGLNVLCGILFKNSGSTAS